MLWLRPAGLLLVKQEGVIHLDIMLLHLSFKLRKQSCPCVCSCFFLGNCMVDSNEAHSGHLRCPLCASKQRWDLFNTAAT